MLCENTVFAKNRQTLAICGLLVVLTILIIAGAGIGASFMPPERVIAALLGEGKRADYIILWKLRLPRVLLALLSGCALALAGAILQRTVRNPLAAPSVLGVTDGTAVGTLVFLWLISDQTSALQLSIHWMPVASIVGALLFTLVTGALTLSDPKRSPLSLILYGIAMAALAKALVVLLMILGPIHRASQAKIWLTGSVSTAHWSDVAILFGALAVALPLLGCMARSLFQLRLDPLTARATGLNLGRSQLVLLLLSVYLTSIAVAFVGALGFVGLVSPHIARLIVGEKVASYLAVTALSGAALVLAADIIARVSLPPLELPAGALTAFISAPLFLFLLTKRRAINA
ncbi:FecCD family ABC transporter permease [Polycladidibacter hongkongensis]|uniref:FecCD family ABC transporter permease n=1 Tax=Polycladidibacter hongkongensis TaxID=1647556 RepID=UPI000833262E|nr:iron ABC transporter permease [Pseudovibrio hongkongensis]